MSNPFSVIFRRSRRRQWLYPMLALLVTLGVSLGSPQPSPAFSWFDLILQGVQVIKLSNISDNQEVQIGKQINQQLVGSDVQLYRNSAIDRYVSQIGQRLAAASTRPDIPYKFQVVKNNSINAFATMGGFVYVNTGLLKAADNEAELASVLAHEIGHIASRHAVEQMRQRAIESGLASAAGLDRNIAAQIGVDLAIQRPTSRQHEFEADQKGLRTLERADYAPSGMIAFMKKLLRAPSVPTFLSDHPATADRIAALQRAINPQKANVGDGLNNAVYKAKIRSLLGS